MALPFSQKAMVKSHKLALSSDKGWIGRLSNASAESKIV